MQMQSLDEVSEDLEIEVLEGTIENGELLASVLEVNGKEIQLDGHYAESEVMTQLLTQLATEEHEWGSGVENEDKHFLEQTDLRYEENRHMTVGTVRHNVLIFVVSNFPATSVECAEHFEDYDLSDTSSAMSDLRKRGMIAVIDTNGSSSYLYVPTHVGIKEVLVNRHESQEGVTISPLQNLVKNATLKEEDEESSEDPDEDRKEQAELFQ